MQKVRDYIATAAFHALFKNRMGFESLISKNPSSKELREVSYKAPGNNFEVGAWLADNDLYVFDRYGVLHGETREHIKADKNFLALYITYRGKEAYITVTDSSRTSKWHHHPETKEYITAHPELRKHFKQIEVAYYDEDIVGDWEDIDAEA